MSVEDTLLFLLLSLTAFQMFPVWLNVVQVFEMFRWTNNWNDVEVAIFFCFVYFFKSQFGQTSEEL